MKYTREQIIRTVTTNKEINDEEEVKNLLDRLLKANADISIEFRDGRSQLIMRHGDSRIKTVADDCISISTRRRKAVFKVNDIKIKDILSIKLVTDKQNIILDGPETDEFDFIDLDEGN
jgi:hypothetical protein